MNSSEQFLIPEERLIAFDTILETIRWAIPGSNPVIGGGALRDSILGGPIKDVDVFLRKQDHDTLDHQLTRKVPTPALFVSYGRPDMHGAWDFIQDLEGYPVQLILADFEGLHDLAHTFDLNLSRATYDGEQLYVTEEFKQGALKKSFEILRADNVYEVNRSTKRVARMLDKYPDFTTPSEPHPQQEMLLVRARRTVPESQADCVWCKAKVFK
jgi:hypothetical protein